MSLESDLLRNSLWSGLEEEYDAPEIEPNRKSRLKPVRVERRDARELFKMFLNRPATLVYLDPPYLMTRDHGYKVDANEREFHEELLKLCVQAKCMVLVSGYSKLNR